MRQRATQNWKALSVLVVAVCLAKTAMAQDYPRYAPAGSTFVPLDSWVYPALIRLAALGWVTTALEGMKPWTRTECARLTQDAGEAMRDAIQEGHGPSEEAVRLQKVLEREFAPDLEALSGGRNRSFRLESVYVRALSISGPPLTDGFHFGQTVAYDFGRPFRRGFNAISGGAVRATAGPFAFYVRAEYQHAPAAPALSDAVRNFAASFDAKPLEPALAFSDVNQVRLLDAYATLNLANWQFSFGKQSLDWGLGTGGSMLFSDNAEPLLMGRLTRIVPTRLPGFMSQAGPVRVEFFLGRQEGGIYVPHALIYGHKFSFKVSPHVEIGYGRTVILGDSGSGHAAAFTAENFFRSFLGIRRPEGVPGDNRDTFDLAVRIPRSPASIYAELYADDKPVYFFNPPRGGYRVGLYVARLPRLARFDLRIEATCTDSSHFEGPRGDLNYWNFQYRDGYTNRGVLLGNVVGRQGRNFQMWSTYHLSETQTLELSFKHNDVNPSFVPGGGHWQDYFARYEKYLSSGFYLRSLLQYEHIRSFPILFLGTVNNVSASVELGYMPSQRKP